MQIPNRKRKLQKPTRECRAPPLPILADVRIHRMEQWYFYKPRWINGRSSPGRLWCEPVMYPYMRSSHLVFSSKNNDFSTKGQDLPLKKDLFLSAWIHLMARHCGSEVQNMGRKLNSKSPAPCLGRKADIQRYVIWIISIIDKDSLKQMVALWTLQQGEGRWWTWFHAAGKLSWSKQ